MPDTSPLPHRYLTMSDWRPYCVSMTTQQTAQPYSTRRPSIDIDGDFAHKKCHDEACR